MLLKTSKLLFILLFGITFSMSANMAIERNLMIFWDCGFGENLFSRLNHSGNLIGPVTAESLIALYEEPGAILLATSTLRNILTLGEFFNDFTEKSTEDLTKKYGRYQPFEEENLITSFSNTCKYLNENYLKLSELLKDSSTQEELYKKIQAEPFFEWKNSSRFYELEAITRYLMCAKFPFDRFVIKKLELNGYIYGYLFIPHSYLRKLDIDPSLLNENSEEIDKDEITLGLKINHLADIEIDPQELLSFKKGFVLKDCRKSVIQFLDLIFVKNTDIQDPLLLKPWAIYWSSHGMFKQEFPEKIEKIKSLQNNVKLKETELNDLKKQYSNNERTVGYKKSRQGIELEGQIRMEEFNLSTIKFELANSHWEKEAYKPKVAGLTVKQFKNTLTFLNNEIITGFLFYTSCFAGGHLAIDAYKNATSNSLSSFNYPIATDSSFDVPTRKEIITTSLGAYFNEEEGTFNQEELEKIIDFKETGIPGKRIILNSNFNYRKFFSELEQFPTASKPSSYLKVFTNVNPLLNNFRNRNWLQALPSIRFPGTKWFNTVELPKNVEIITKVKALARGDQRLLIDQDINNKLAILLYTKNIPFEIKIKASPKENFPSIVSMNPGTAIHILDSLDASESDLSTVLLSFFPFAEFTGSKLFHIKKLTVNGDGKLGTYLNKPAIYTNVMIVYNGKLNETDKFSNFIFFTGPYNYVFSYEWTAGSRLPDTFNSELNLNSPKDYKDKLLKYFSDREPKISEEKFSGILETTEGQEKVTIDTVKKLLEKKAMQLQELKLQKSIIQLQHLTQSLINLDSQFNRIA